MVWLNADNRRQVHCKAGRAAHLANNGSAHRGSATAIGPIETVVDEDLLQDFNVN